MHQDIEHSLPQNTTNSQNLLIHRWQNTDLWMKHMYVQLTFAPQNRVSTWLDMITMSKREIQLSDLFRSALLTYCLQYMYLTLLAHYIEFGILEFQHWSFEIFAIDNYIIHGMEGSGSQSRMKVNNIWTENMCSCLMTFKTVSLHPLPPPLTSSPWSCTCLNSQPDQKVIFQLKLNKEQFLKSMH